MAILELSFSSGENTLSVRKFSVQESLAGMFNATIEARSPNEDIDLEAIVGKPALFRIVSGVAWAHLDTRLWTGVVSEMELIRVEASGLSTYEIKIVPQMWLLTQRTNYRMFQHQSVPEIVCKMLDEWRIRYEKRIDDERYPKLELRTQYGESDYAFVSRLLEEAGITFYYEDDVLDGSKLILNDTPHKNEPRQSGPVRFVDDASAAKAAEHDYVTDIRIGNRVRPAKLTIRDFDFRRPGFALFGESQVENATDAKLEEYHYQPGAFLHETQRSGETPSADDRGALRHHGPSGTLLAHKRLEGHRASKRLLRFKTNAMDLSPGTVFAVGGHARKDLTATHNLLVNSLTIEGEVGQEWNMYGSATFADSPFRPALATKKPKIWGVQSAIVTGPKDEVVHTDEYGRVRVQFHWDREGRFDEKSSVWIRVSQPWAGAGYGMINLPRIGNEVLVSFIEGDPDNPIIVGRVFNGSQQVPYKLPEANLMSAWKSDSNSNIILYIDIPGFEYFMEQAEKDRLGVVKNDLTDIIGNTRSAAIRKDDGAVIGGNFARGVMGEYSVISQKELSLSSQKAVSLAAGMEISQTSGYKWQAGVTPVIPMILAALGVKIVKAKLDAAFPAGPPDLFAIIQAQAAAMGINLNGQLPPGISVVAAIPAEVKDILDKLFEDMKGLFGNVIQPLLDILSQLSWSDLQQIFALIASAPDLETVMALFEQLMPSQPGQPGLKDIIDDLKKLFDAFMSAIPDTTPAPGASASTTTDDKAEKTLKKILIVLKFFSMITDEIAPGTGIKIEPNKIRLTTGKATIEMKGEDIEIKAKGNIKIEGACVSISPPIK
ncbi:MAG: type VI secretion system tip protein VgrG [Polyangiaceae bacterium]|nr:type VI secretion system tip protein VgrG [Polyangiaceae bacterium]